jgi:hypothetical protein
VGNVPREDQCTLLTFVAEALEDLDTVGVACLSFMLAPARRPDLLRCHVGSAAARNILGRMDVNVAARLESLLQEPGKLRLACLT